MSSAISKKLLLLPVAAFISTTFFAQTDRSLSDELWDMGYEARKSGDYGASLDYLTQAISIDSSIAALYNSRGKTYFDMALSGTYDSSAVSRLLNYALQDYNRGLACTVLTDTIKSEILINRGALSGLQGDLEACILDCTQGISLDSTNKNGYYNRSIAYYNLGEYESALQDYSSFTKLDTTNAAVFYEKGMVERHLGYHENAISSLTRSIYLDGTLGIAYLERARAYALSGNEKKAKSDYRKAEELGVAKGEYDKELLKH